MHLHKERTRLVKVKTIKNEKFNLISYLWTSLLGTFTLSEGGSKSEKVQRIKQQTSKKIFAFAPSERSLVNCVPCKLKKQNKTLIVIVCDDKYFIT